MCVVRSRYIITVLFVKAKRDVRISADLMHLSNGEGSSNQGKEFRAKKALSLNSDKLPPPIFSERFINCEKQTRKT